MLSVSCFTLLSWSVPPCEQEEMEVARRKAQVSLGPHLGGVPRATEKGTRGAQGSESKAPSWPPSQPGWAGWD